MVCCHFEQYRTDQFLRYKHSAVVPFRNQRDHGSVIKIKQLNRLHQFVFHSRNLKAIHLGKCLHWYFVHTLVENRIERGCFCFLWIVHPIFHHHHPLITGLGWNEFAARSLQYTCECQRPEAHQIRICSALGWIDVEFFFRNHIASKCGATHRSVAYNIDSYNMYFFICTWSCLTGFSLAQIEFNRNSEI